MIDEPFAAEAALEILDCRFEIKKKKKGAEREAALNAV